MYSVARKDDYAVKGRDQVSEIRSCQALTQDKCQPALKAAWPLRRPKLDRSAHNPQKMLGSRSLTGSQLSFHSGIAPLPEYGKCAGQIRQRRKHDCGESGRRASCQTVAAGDRKSTRLNSSHPSISYAVFCLKKKK